MGVIQVLQIFLDLTLLVGVVDPHQRRRKHMHQNQLNQEHMPQNQVQMNIKWGHTNQHQELKLNI